MRIKESDFLDMVVDLRLSQYITKVFKITISRLNFINFLKRIWISVNFERAFLLVSEQNSF